MTTWGALKNQLLDPPNRSRLGVMGLVVVLLGVAVGQTITSVPMLFASPSYYGQFSNTGGLKKGDKVRITGMNVGSVEDVKIAGDRIVMKFSIGANTIGTESRLAVRTDTILGKKVLQIEPRGTQTLRPSGVLPLAQSTTPYQIYDAFSDATKAAAGWNIDTVKQSLNVLSQTINQTYPHLSAALDGVAKFSDTIGKRDDDVKHLLAQANKVARVLSDRGPQVDRLLVNSNALLAAFNERSRAISALLDNVSAFSAQVQNLINDNPNLNHCARAIARCQRPTGSPQGRPGSISLDRSQIHGGTQRGHCVGAVFQGVAGKLAAILDLAAVGGRRVQEARYRSRGLLAQCRFAGLPVPRPERHAVPQWGTAAGAAGAGRHPGSPGAGGATRHAVLVYAVAGLVAAAGKPAALRGIGSGAVRRQFPRADRRRDIATQPERPPADTGDPDRRPAGRRCNPTCRAHRCRSRPDRPGAAPSRWDRCRDPLRRNPAAAPPRPPLAVPRGAAGTRQQPAGAVHQSRRSGRQRRAGR